MLNERILWFENIRFTANSSPMFHVQRSSWETHSTFWKSPRHLSLEASSNSKEQLTPPFPLTFCRFPTSLSERSRAPCYSHPIGLIFSCPAFFRRRRAITGFLQNTVCLMENFRITPFTYRAATGSTDKNPRDWFFCPNNRKQKHQTQTKNYLTLYGRFQEIRTMGDIHFKDRHHRHKP